MNVNANVLAVMIELVQIEGIGASVGVVVDWNLHLVVESQVVHISSVSILVGVVPNAFFQ